MILKAKIEASGDADRIYKCFKPELIKKERSECRLRKSGNKVVFDITAKDSVALRATLNAVTQMLTIYEKMKEIS